MSTAVALQSLATSDGTEGYEEFHPSLPLTAAGHTFLPLLGVATWLHFHFLYVLLFQIKSKVVWLQLHDIAAVATIWIDVWKTECTYGTQTVNEHQNVSRYILAFHLRPAHVNTHNPFDFPLTPLLVHSTYEHGYRFCTSGTTKYPMNRYYICSSDGMARWGETLWCNVAAEKEKDDMYI